MSTLIHDHWREKQELPGIDCIAFPDGRVIILSCTSVYNPNSNTRAIYCSPLCDTTIDSLERYGSTYWTNVDPWASIDYLEGKILGGDGSMGNQGYIARTGSCGELIWGIFFEDTNPIKSLELQGHTLVAVNEHGDMRIQINLENLTEISMTYLN